MNIIPKFETPTVTERTEKQIDSPKQWIDGIELSDDSEEWQDSIELPDDVRTLVEKQKGDLSRFEEAKQIKQMVDYLNALPEVKRENWINLSFDERVKVVQKIEKQTAKVGCRPALAVETAPLSMNNYGNMNWESQKIVINESLIRSNKPEDFQKVLKTLLHESRHAFQYSNIALERTEPNDEKYKSWMVNLATGYCAAKLFGFKNYYLQPMEVDARVFSEAIVSRLKTDRGD